MIDADIISSKTSEKVKKILNIQDIERPVSIQLIGNKKNILVKALLAVEAYADIIDFNVGCIEKDYLQKGCGTALLNDLPKLENLIRVLVETTKKPVTAKIRIGWSNQSIKGVKV